LRALFDINVLIALFDPAHVNHDAAHHWLDTKQEHGWATCPLTQNGCVRILSQPRYPNAVSTSDALRRLRDATSHTDHEFWPDAVSIIDTTVFRADYLLAPRQLTDIYLLGLAVRRGGRLVTFDRSISSEAVVDAQPEHLVVL
jgi:toxin-antitoxin system PIN domain toxin